MRDLIRFDDAQKAVCDGCAKQFATLPCESSDCQIQESLVHVLPVDAAPVSRGEWVVCKKADFTGMSLEYYYVDKCTACGYEHYGSSVKHYNFCPNCGADMRGETE